MPLRAIRRISSALSRFDARLKLRRAVASVRVEALETRLFLSATDNDMIGFIVSEAGASVPSEHRELLPNAPQAHSKKKPRAKKHDRTHAKKEHHHSKGHRDSHHHKGDQVKDDSEGDDSQGEHEEDGGTGDDHDDGDHEGIGDGHGEGDDGDDGGDSGSRGGGGSDSGGGNTGGSNQRPTASISVPNVTVAGAKTLSVVVTYTDDKGIKASTIDVNDLLVSGPSGKLTVTGVTMQPATDAAKIVAIYTLAAPGGRWGIADNGNYSVNIVDGQVTDGSGNAVAAVNKTFVANITSTETEAPRVTSITAPDIVSAGTNAQVITVVYADNVAVDPVTIGPADITVTGPSGPLTVSIVNVDTDQNETPITATYTVSTPGGSWDHADEGTYNIVVNAGEVQDSNGNFNAAASGSFKVNIAAPPPVDAGFGGGGGVKTPFVAEAVVTQPDGKVLVAGRQGDPTSGKAQGVLERLDASGALDLTFGNRGEVITPAGANETFYAIVTQGNNSIVAGTSGGDFLLARYDASGHLDPTFGKGGRVVTDMGSENDAVFSMDMGPDGMLVVAGGAAGNFAFARFDANGAIDASFGTGGKVLFDFGSDADIPGAVSVQADGKIVAAGSSGTKVAVLRLTASGAADSTFSGDGLTFLDGVVATTSGDRSQGVAIQADGKILLANHTAGQDFAVSRLDAAGNLDQTFGSNGIATADFGGDDDADSVLVQSTGEILVIGTSLAAGKASTCVAAFDASGKLIPTFGDGGKLVLDSGVTPTGREMHIGELVLRAFGTRQSDGSLVIGTSDQSPGTTSSGLRRLTVPGTKAQPQGTFLGHFGIVSGERVKLAVTDADNTKMVLSIKGGSAKAYLSGSRINLVLTDAGAGCTLSIKTQGGGDGRVTIGDVAVSGTLKGFSCKTADLAGTMCSTGAIGKLTLGDVTGVIASSSSIGAFAASSLKGSRILAGANLGADGRLGGINADADSYAQGSIGSVKVNGAVSSSLIGAGLNPVDDTFLDGDDRVVGAAASFIRSIFAKTADSSTRFVAHAVGAARLPGKVDPAQDPRFMLL